MDPRQHSKYNLNADRIKIIPSGLHEHNLAPIIHIHDVDASITRFVRRVKLNFGTVSTDQLPLLSDDQSTRTQDAPKRSNSERSADFEDKYGRYKGVVGWGSTSIVKVSYKRNAHSGESGYLYAVKSFRPKTKKESGNSDKMISAEFCIATGLQHQNVIHTLDLLRDDDGLMCQIMEFCAAGDLCTLLLAVGRLKEVEADCFYKQLMRGVEYCHSMGVAHRDLKPENLVLTTRGCLKITDFGNADCIKMAWEEKVHYSSGIRGSRPYCAPEVLTQKKFDGRAVDVWATGVIYVAMRTGKLMWSEPRKEDAMFRKYMHNEGTEEGFAPIDMLEGVSRFLTF